MSIRYQADNDLNQLIVSATYRKEPSIDFQTAQKAGFDYLDDATVLRRAASEGRILISHDKRTMPQYFASFLNQGNTSPGVFLVIPQDAPLRSVVETLVLNLGGQHTRRLAERDHDHSILADRFRAVHDGPHQGAPVFYPLSPEITALPDNSDAVLPEYLVSAHKLELFSDTLGGDHPVKRVFVTVRQA